MKAKIKTILGVIIATFFVGQLPLNEILQPAVSDPNFWAKAHQAQVVFGYSMLTSVFLIFAYLGWIFYDFYKELKK